MLNYIWIALILIGILVAVGNDVGDEIRNPYRNGEPFEALMEIQKTPSPLRTTWEGELIISGEDFNAFYGQGATGEDIRQPVTVAVSADGDATLLLPIGEGSPEFWQTIVKNAMSSERLAGKVLSFKTDDDRRTGKVRFVLEAIRFVKLKSVTQAAFEYAGVAVKISLGLIGIMALWLGVMKVGEEAGMLRMLTRVLAPVTKRLFPDVPHDHPAVGAMIMNMAANMLGLSNAATPMGLKAMEELNKLNPKVGTATNAMVTFLAINTGGLVLIPATAIAVRAAAGSVNPGIIIGTSIVGATCATVTGVVVSKILQRLPRYKKALEV
ncbi:MAG: nucleoside recognition domain-containing protein [Bacteroidota bacterium]